MVPGHRLSPRSIRLAILAHAKRANVGHIGSALSVADILVALYGSVLRLDGDSADRDRFILSKGHAALALYAALHLSGRLPADALDAYCADGSLFSVHPEHGAPGVDFGTGSLGHGLPTGVGAALAARLSGSGRRTFVLISDAECNEGSVWEAAMFASHHQLGALVAILDFNGQQALGYTRDILDPSTIRQRWEAFGWQVIEVDGHDVSAIGAAAEGASDRARPRLVLAHTVFGKGVPFMERQIKWHYWPMSDDEYVRAVAAVKAES
jgi:transketolase